MSALYTVRCVVASRFLFFVFFFWNKYSFGFRNFDWNRVCVSTIACDSSHALTSCDSLEGICDSRAPVQCIRIGIRVKKKNSTQKPSLSMSMSWCAYALAPAHMRVCVCAVRANARVTWHHATEKSCEFRCQRSMRDVFLFLVRFHCLFVCLFIFATRFVPYELRVNVFHSIVSFNTH